MADGPFTADSTIPGLSGRDLARRVLSLFGAAGSSGESRRENALRALAGLDRRTLQDIGLDRDAA